MGVPRSLGQPPQNLRPIAQRKGNPEVRQSPVLPHCVEGLESVKAPSCGKGRRMLIGADGET